MTQPAPYEVREEARYAYINHEGYGRVEGFNAAADLAYAAGVAAGRKQAAEAIRAKVAALPFNAARPYMEGLVDAADIAEEPA